MRTLYVFLLVFTIFTHSSRYEVLSDPDKRQIYDTRGEAGLSEAGGMGGMDPQVCCNEPTHCAVLTPNLIARIYLVSFLVEVVSVAVVSSVAVEDRDLAKQKISSIGCMSRSRTFTRAKQPSLHSREMSSVQSVKGRVERTALSGLAALATVGVSK